MEEKTNPIIQEKINQMRCKAKFIAFQPCKKRGRATRMGHLPVSAQRLVPTTQKAQNINVVNFVNILSGAVHRRDCPRSVMKQKAKERRLFPEKKRKRRQECSGYCENCTTIGLRLARLGCIGFSKWKTPDARSLGFHSKSTVHSLYAT